MEKKEKEELQKEKLQKFTSALTDLQKEKELSSKQVEQYIYKWK